jgi:cyclic beta-1,2-glucan synthetase
MLSTLSACDLGYLRPSRLAERIDRMLTTLEGIERFKGHFLNWYDTQSLAPLHPRYVSTVDSGNLAGCLMILAQGCARPPRVRARRSRRTGLGTP